MNTLYISSLVSHFAFPFPEKFPRSKFVNPPDIRRMVTQITAPEVPPKCSTKRYCISGMISNHFVSEREGGENKMDPETFLDMANQVTT